MKRSSKHLAGLTVLITGAGGGFGQELTRQFLQAGSHVILTDLHTDALPAPAGEMAGAQGTILGHVAADLSTPDGCVQLAETALSLTPHIDILVNNAGLGMAGVISDIPQAQWERLMQVNLLAPMRLTALLLPGMIERRSGHIVHMSSVAGLVGPPGLSAYSASKFGLRGFGEALQADVRPYGIDVTIVYPFYARTPILDSPQYGQSSMALPDWLLYDPDIIVAALVAGVRQRRVHVYPGAIPRWIDLLRRAAPWLLALLTRSPAKA